MIVIDGNINIVVRNVNSELSAFIAYSHSYFRMMHLRNEHFSYWNW